MDTRTELDLKQVFLDDQDGISKSIGMLDKDLHVHGRNVWDFPCLRGTAMMYNWKMFENYTNVYSDVSRQYLHRKARDPA